MKNFVEIVFILDRSGSMAGLESDTIGGLNGMLAKQKKLVVNYSSSSSITSIRLSS